MDNPTCEKIRLLFVDDDPNVLAGLRRMLRPWRSEWEAEFANNGYETLERMDQAGFDVLITDMRMPGMDGANLLQEVSLRYPHVARFVLSGQSDRATILRAVGAAHQFISKPCDADYLRRVVNRTMARRRVVANEPVRNNIAQIKSIPSPLNTCQALCRFLEGETPDIGGVAGLVADDAALTAKVFQLINSDLFGRVKNLQTVEQAVNLLGSEVLCAMMETSDLFTVYDPAPEGQPFPIELIEEESRAMGRCAWNMAASMGAGDEWRLKVRLAGMLQNIGALVLLACMPDAYPKLCREHRLRGAALCAKEKEAFGVSHTEAGAYLLSLWGFSESIVEAVEYCHKPAHATGANLLPLAAVHLAYAVQSRRRGMEAGLDAAFLERQGFPSTVEQGMKCMETDA